jgi:hypothetical protein
MTPSPTFVFIGFVVGLWLAARTGALLRGRRPPFEPAEWEDTGVLVGATLTLLGLLIGFSFSMAVARYDLRKNCEEEEANAIGTEYLRAGLLRPADTTTIRGLLKRYLDERISYYEIRDASQLQQIDAATAHTQTELWSAVQAAAAVQPTSTVALSVDGMNDVLNRQGYTQAAFRNRIPIAAWFLLAAISLLANYLLGFYSRLTSATKRRSFVLPFMIATSLALIADMDTPRKGVIRVIPQNLLSLSGSLNGP